MSTCLSAFFWILTVRFLEGTGMSLFANPRLLTSVHLIYTKKILPLNSSPNPFQPCKQVHPPVMKI